MDDPIKKKPLSPGDAAASPHRLPDEPGRAEEPATEQDNPPEVPPDVEVEPEPEPEQQEQTRGIVGRRRR